MAAKFTYEDVRDLYGQHGPALLAYGTSLLGERAAAEDVLHQVFLKLLGMEKLPEDARPYLFKAVRNRCLNAMRGGRRLTSLNEDADGAEWLVKPAGMVEAGLDVEKAMRELPPEQREVVVMRIWGRMTLAEVAAVLEIPENTAASRYRYALAKLRGLLQGVRNES
jgi:RNA polymerase sigma-70 factor (ECF subfamily)